MTREQAEAFVQAVASATGRLPLIYVHPTWANGGARITPGSILARCGLWVVGYHESPTIPRAWATSGWRLWQYASDEYAGRRAHRRNKNHPRSGPLRSQLVQWRRGCALPVLECRRLIERNGAPGRRFELSETPSRRERMSASGQSRRFECVSMTSGLPR